MEEDTSPKAPFVYLSNTGGVYDDKPIRVVSSCKLEIYTFPFDIQNCTLTFGSYMHFGEAAAVHHKVWPLLFIVIIELFVLKASDIRMTYGSTAEDVLQESRDVLETNGEWELSDIQIAPFTLSVGGDDYSQVKYFVSRSSSSSSSKQNAEYMKLHDTQTPSVEVLAPPWGEKNHTTVSC